MTILSNDVGTTTEGGPKPAQRLTAPVGYNVRLFKGGLWILQPQAVMTIGTGNAAITVIAKGSYVGTSVTISLQAANQAAGYSYSAPALTIKPATNGTPATTSTAAQMVALLTAAYPATANDTLIFIAGGDGSGVVQPATVKTFSPINCWIPGSVITASGVGGARGENSSVYADNRGGYPGGPGPLGAAAIYATAEQGIHKWQNDIAGSPLTSILQAAYQLDDNTVSAAGSGSACRIGLVVGLGINNLEVFIDETR